MMRDIWTVMWKELKELFARQGRFSGGITNFILVLVVFGVVMPWQLGRAWVDSPMMLLYWGWVPLTLLSNVVIDAFAGERERHTLETLLASRLPDRAILFGKMLAAIAYGLAVTVCSLVLGIVTVNILVGQGALLLYPAATLAGALVASVLGATLIAGLGVLVSLHSASVRQASQMMGVAVLLVGLAPGLAIRGIAQYWKAHSHTTNPFEMAILGFAMIAVFVVVDAGLIGATMMRFRRSRLLLD